MGEGDLRLKGNGDLRRTGKGDLRRTGEGDLRRLIGEGDLRRLIGEGDLRRRTGECDLSCKGEGDLRLKGERNLRRTGDGDLCLKGDLDLCLEYDDFLRCGEGESLDERLRRGVIERFLGEQFILSEDMERFLCASGDLDTLLDFCLQLRYACIKLGVVLKNMKRNNKQLTKVTGKSCTPFHFYI